MILAFHTVSIHILQTAYYFSIAEILNQSIVVFTLLATRKIVYIMVILLLAILISDGR